MTGDQFFETFSKTLDVAEPKRSDIIAELRGHFDEADQNVEPSKHFGDPRRLALKYNRVHVGFLHTSLRLFGAPVAVFLFMLILSQLFSQPAENYTSVIGGFGYYCTKALLVIAPLCITIVISKTLQRKYKKGFEWLFLVFETIMLSFAYTTFTAGGGYVSLAIFSSILIGLAMMLISFCTIVISSPVQYPTQKKTTGGQLYFEILLFSFLIIFSFLCVMVITELVFAPFDVALIRPPEGTIIRDVNDFFENGAGGIILAGLVELGLFALFIRRLSLYHKLNAHHVVVWGMAFLMSATIAYVDFISHNSLLTFVLLACAGLLLSLVRPFKVWRWGCIIGLTIPIMQLLMAFIFSSRAFSEDVFIVSFFSVLPALAGSYVGLSISQAWQQKKKISV